MTFLREMKVEVVVGAEVQVQMRESDDTPILMTDRAENVAGLHVGGVLTPHHALHLQSLHERMGTRGLGPGGLIRALLGDHQAQSVQKTIQEIMDLRRASHQDHLSLLFPLRPSSNHSIQIFHRHLLPNSMVKAKTNLEHGLHRHLLPYRTSIFKINNSTVLGLHRLPRWEIHHRCPIHSSKETTHNPHLDQAAGSKEMGEATMGTGTGLVEEATIAAEAEDGDYNLPSLTLTSCNLYNICMT